MMKRGWARAYGVLILLITTDVFIITEWNWFWFSLVPFLVAGLILFTIAFVSGGERQIIDKFRLPEEMADCLVRLGKFYKRGCPSIFEAGAKGDEP